MHKILISCCLLSEPVCYDGRGVAPLPLLSQWLHEGRLVPVCPECSAGLPVPRAPAEICDGDGYTVLRSKAQVGGNQGNDLSETFRQGAL